MEKPISNSKVYSNFLKFRYLLLFFSVLLISVLVITTTFNNVDVYSILRTILLTTFIFAINFYLGYTLIKIFFLKKPFYIIKTIILLVISYIVIPVILGYIVLDIFGQPFDNNFTKHIILIISINFLVNTLLLLFYGSNTTVVEFASEKEVKKIFPHEVDLNEKENEVNQLNQARPNQTEVEHYEESSSGNVLDKNGLEDAKRYLIFRRNRVLYRVKFSDIVYLEVNLNTVLLQTVKEFYETRSTLGEIMIGLPNTFVQVSKSIVINLDYFEQLVFENETKRSKVKVKFLQSEEEVEDSFYVGRKYLVSLKNILTK